MGVPEIVRRAIEIGERNGKITFNELDLRVHPEIDGVAVRSHFERTFSPGSDIGRYSNCGHRRSMRSM